MEKKEKEERRKAHVAWSSMDDVPEDGVICCSFNDSGVGICICVRAYV